MVIASLFLGRKVWFLQRGFMSKLCSSSSQYCFSKSESSPLLLTGSYYPNFIMRKLFFCVFWYIEERSLAFRTAGALLKNENLCYVNEEVSVYSACELPSKIVARCPPEYNDSVYLTPGHIRFFNIRNSSFVASGSPSDWIELLFLSRLWSFAESSSVSSSKLFSFTTFSFYTFMFNIFASKWVFKILFL